MAVGEAFLSAFLQVLFDRLASRQFIGLLRVRNFDDLLEGLKITLLAITAVLNDAEEKQFDSPAVEKWLHLTKSAVYDAEDLLDELATQALLCNLDSGCPSPTTPNQVRANWNRISSSLNPFNNKAVESKIKKIIEKLEYISQQKDVLDLKDHSVINAVGRKQRSPTTSLVDEACVYGRHCDKERIIEVLLGGEENRGASKIGVVPIVGMGGIGKTTLAQLVYNEKRVVRHFQLRVWVCVSQPFDVVRVTNTIFQSVTRKRFDLHDLNLLQVSLKAALAGKKFLLVLDDVWDKRNNDWDLLWCPLRAGAWGSKIIVTTRNQYVAASMGTVPAHHLTCLPSEDCWSLFKMEAFENKNIDAHHNLEAIGREIVKQCDGLPLAVKRLGVLLSSRAEEDEWKDILSRKIWDLPDDERDILHTLRLSYDHLPVHLKQCFAYCSIFPKHYEFVKDSLVLLWLSEGFLLQPKGNKRLEDVGGDYFNDLVSMSFFLPSSNHKSHFVMHELMKDLAQYVSGDLCFRLEDKLEVCIPHKNFENAHHSSYIRGKRDMSTKFEAFQRLECLRTFLPLDPVGEIGVSYLPNQVPCDLLPRLKFLRVLSFNGYRITKLPDSIGNLKHLRYLNLSHTAINMLPASVSTLCNLETLLLLQCRALVRLPMNMGNLTNLRHLCISETKLKEMPLQMCRLTNLQTLSNFMVGKNGSGIRDLKNMLHLHGTLIISGLQNVVSFRDAIEANLREKPKLDELVLQWSNISDDPLNETTEEEFFEIPHRRKNLKETIPSFREAMEAYEQTIDEVKQCNDLVDIRNQRIETDVLEMLQPHKSLKQLMIKDYGGVRFPSWVGSPSFSKVIILKLSNCKNCKCLPPLGQLPSLKDLTIEGMEGISSVGPEFCGDGNFPSLQSLKFENMFAWEDWSSPEIEDRECFQQLYKIEIYGCPKLRNISFKFPALKKMCIVRCKELAALPKLPMLNNTARQEGGEFPCLHELSLRTCPNLWELPNLFPSLVMLDIDECQKLASLPGLPMIDDLELKKCDEGVLQNVVSFTSLTYLRMSQVPKLTCLPEGFFQQLTALKELQIANFSELTTLSNQIGLQNLPFLRRLEISGCPHLKDLPQSLHMFPSLKELRVWKCPSLLSFPLSGFPCMLTGLEIKECEALVSFPPWMMHNTTNITTIKVNTCPPLEHLVIDGCSSLLSLPSGHLPSTIKSVDIQNCINLEFLPEMMHNNTSLEFLKIAGCPIKYGMVTLLSFMRLKKLVIDNCTNLQFLPDGLNKFVHLKHLDIANCLLLVSFLEPGLPPPKLLSLRISNCRDLKSLPNQMHSLVHLQELSLDGCPSLASFPEGGLPSDLISLAIFDCEKLMPSYEWGLHRLTSLSDFSFGGCSALVSFPEEWLLPSTLRSFQIHQLPNLRSLPEGLQNLKSLEIEISECDNLLPLPEGGPSEMLQNLQFWERL
ncbi:putative disease resistance RPP13-like protein 1 [Malania oleifera]|uniref:putative disease resistance RPP13-like protein 1 n=1 Tax=Malania oleifera TaxID=397392 RepID=UPI0025ADE5E8|nr:putative disease resistance RPP13-like protein 1 [Malania oleifera]XP_057963165.1 putative disease resistance RPP13-like protein 1 [Malania oleifera]